jgi:hypothetical protein
MKFTKFTGVGLLIAIVCSISTSSLFAQPSYYYPPPPPPGYMQNMPPPNFNGGYPPQYYGNNGGYPPPYYQNNRGGFNRFSNGNFSNGPFSNGPWNRFNNGWGNGNGNNYGPDTQWFTDTPRRWMRNGPKEGAGQVFDDFLDAPSRMGDMPGGWSAPTISVPNPIDVADELERGSQDIFNSN